MKAFGENEEGKKQTTVQREAAAKTIQAGKKNPKKKQIKRVSCQSVCHVTKERGDSGVEGSTMSQARLSEATDAGTQQTHSRSLADLLGLG